MQLINNILLGICFISIITFSFVWYFLFKQIMTISSSIQIKIRWLEQEQIFILNMVRRLQESKCDKHGIKRDEWL